MARVTSGDRPCVIVLAGYIGGLGAARSLGEMGVPVVLATVHDFDFAGASRYVVERVRVPDPAADEEGLLTALEELSDRHPGAVLMPASDAMLIAVSRNRDRLESIYRVAAEAWPIVEGFIDKQRTYELAPSFGVRVPRTQMLFSEDDVERLGRDVEYPVLVKPAQSHLYVAAFDRKLTEVTDLEGLRVAYREARAAGVEVLLQELIPGLDEAGANYNSYWWDGRPLLEFTARKLRLAPTKYGLPCAIVSRSIPEVIVPGRRLLEATGYSGYACIEFKRDTRDGLYRLMDVNPHINLSSLLATRAGINFPWLTYRHLAFGELPSPRSFRSNIHWIDGAKDLSSGFRGLRAGRISLRSFIRPYIRNHVFAVVDGRDLGPALRRYSAALRTLIRSLRGTGPVVPT